MQVAFGRVRRKTEPTGPGTEAIFFLKLTLMGAVGNADRIWVSTPQNRTYRACSENGSKERKLEWFCRTFRKKERLLIVTLEAEYTVLFCADVERIAINSKRGC